MLFTTSRPIVRLCWLLTALIGLTNQPGLGQSVAQNRWQGQVAVGGWAASGQVIPFWLRANQWGTVPLTAPAGTLQASIWKPYRTDTTSRPRRFDWSAGAQVVGNAATESHVLLPELYVKGHWKAIELSAGRWRQLTGLGDSTLSSGFINGSGNAIPIPKVQLATRGYVPLGFTKRFYRLIYNRTLRLKRLTTNRKGKRLFHWPLSAGRRY